MVFITASMPRYDFDEHGHVTKTSANFEKHRERQRGVRTRRVHFTNSLALLGLTNRISIELMHAREYVARNEAQDGTAACLLQAPKAETVHD